MAMTTTTIDSPVDDAAAWRGEDLAGRDDWRSMSGHDCGNVQTAVREEIVRLVDRFEPSLQGSAVRFHIVVGVEPLRDRPKYFDELGPS